MSGKIYVAGNMWDFDNYDAWLPSTTRLNPSSRGNIIGSETEDLINARRLTVTVTDRRREDTGRPGESNGNTPGRKMLVAR